MWAGLSLLLTLCLLHGGGAESEGGGPRCQLPPAWRIGDVEPMKGTMGRVTVVALLQASWLFCLVQASRMDGLHQQLEGEGLKNVAYMVVNHQGAQAQRLHTMMAQRLSENITLYKQDEQQPDVWQTLKGDKDDFLIYDRCGRLTHHISLPYSIIGQGHIEGAIKDAYCKRTCGECTYESAEIPEECKDKSDAQPDAPVVDDTGNGHGHDHGHGHHHGHHHGHGHHHHGSDHGHHGADDGHHGAGHGHHGTDQGFHPRGFGHGHDHNHGQHQGHHDAGHGSAHTQQNIGAQGREQDDRMSQMQHHFDLAQIPQAVHMQQMPHDAHRAPARPWTPEKARWKSKHSWQWTAGSDNEASPKASWCWHWRRLFGDAGSEQPVGLWHCDEALPASWQWHGLIGDAANNVRETWQWRLPPAAWQQPQPTQWAWPPGVVSWGWQQL